RSSSSPVPRPPTRSSPSAGGWQERLAEDVGNLRAAADWFEHDPTAADDNLLFATALHWFWFGLGHYREGRRRIETALERSGDARSPPSRCISPFKGSGGR